MRHLTSIAIFLLVPLFVNQCRGQGRVISVNLAAETEYILDTINMQMEVRKGNKYDHLYTEYRVYFPTVLREFNQTNAYPKNRENLYRYAKTNYPAFAGLMEKLAPILIFQVPHSAQSTQLESIVVEYLSVQFDGSKGINDVSWYDMVLHPENKGKQTFSKSNNEFISENAGRFVFRMWAPSGRYLVKFSFHFASKNMKEFTMMTKPFYLNFYN